MSSINVLTIFYPDDQVIENVVSVVDHVHREYETMLVAMENVVYGVDHRFYHSLYVDHVHHEYETMLVEVEKVKMKKTMMMMMNQKMKTTMMMMTKMYLEFPNQDRFHDDNNFYSS